MSDERQRQSVTFGQDVERATQKRLTYGAPQLRHLGSIRELTLGSPHGGFNDGAFNPKSSRS